MLAHDDELVAAEPAHHITVADEQPQPFGDLSKERIAHRMAVGVVHRLEPIEVQEQHADGLLETRRPRQCLIEQAAQQGSVGQTGQRIVRGRVQQFGLGAPQLRDVDRLHRAVQGRAAVIPDQRCRDLDVHRRTVGGDVPLRATVGGGVAGDEVAETFDVVVDVVGMGELPEVPADDVGDLVAEHRGEARVHAQQPSIERRLGHADGRVVEHPPQPLPGFVDDVGVQAAVRQLSTGEDERQLIVLDDDVAGDHLDGQPVHTERAKPEDDRLLHTRPPRLRAHQQLRGQRQVVRVDDVDGRSPDPVFPGPSEQLLGAAVGVADRSGLIEDHHQLSEMIDHFRGEFGELAIVHGGTIDGSREARGDALTWPLPNRAPCVRMSEYGAEATTVGCGSHTWYGRLVPGQDDRFRLSLRTRARRLVRC